MNDDKDVIVELERADVNFKVWATNPARVFRVYNICNAQDQDRIINLASKLPELNELSVSHCKHITEEGAKAIGRMSSLKNLDISFSQIEGKSFQHFMGLSQLQILLARNIASLSEGVPCLKVLESLHRLSMSGSDLDDDAIAHLCENNEISYLNIDCTRVTGSGFKNFLPTSRISTISAFGCPLTRPGLDSILFLGQLKCLCLSSGNTASHLDLQGARWPALYTLDLLNVKITSEILKELAQIESLTWLRINDSNLANLDLSPLNNLCNLEDLDLSSTGISSTQITSLVKLTRLNELSIPHNGIKPEDLPQIKAALPECDIWCEIEE